MRKQIKGKIKKIHQSLFILSLITFIDAKLCTVFSKGSSKWHDPSRWGHLPVRQASVVQAQVLLVFLREPEQQGLGQFHALEPNPPITWKILSPHRKMTLKIQKNIWFEIPYLYYRYKLAYMSST